jgi:nucleotide-binding universal stress UspA family protein
MPTGVLPFNLDNLLGGAVRVLWAPITEDIPANPADIFDQTGPDYAPNGSWEDFGAAGGGSEYGRAIATSGYQIEQSSSDVLEEVTGLDRTFATSVAEIKPEHLAMIEETPETEIDDVVAAAGHSAFKRVPIGNIDSQIRRRVAFVARRAKGIGADVTEPGGTVRGGFVVGVLYAVTLTADSTSIAFAKGNLASAGITFKAYPVDDVAAGNEFGDWFDETAGTISGS